MAAGSKDNAYDVSDPTDWQGTPLASLTQVEHSLRCHVCKDFFNSPMTTSCCHTFCSLCIRRALNTDAKCPLCRAVDQESRLRGNHAIREAVDAFTTSRDAILQYARQPVTAKTATTPKRKAGEEVDEELAPKRTRMSTRSSSARSSKANAVIMAEESGTIEAPEEEAYVPPDDGLVACPICQWRMEAVKVDRHLDTDCPGKVCPQPVPTKPKTFKLSTARNSTSTPAHTQERLPILNFAILNETKLRKKLQDIGIPASGAKLAMEKRYKEWAMMWNANCDSSRPKTKNELLKDLDIWERTQGSMASTSSYAMNMGAQIKDKNFDGAGWSERHNDSFRDLIANARKSRQMKKADSADNSTGEAQPAEARNAGVQTSEAQQPEAKSTSTPNETNGQTEPDTNGSASKSLPFLPTQPETIRIDRSTTTTTVLTSPSQGQPNGGGILPS